MRIFFVLLVAISCLVRCQQAPDYQKVIQGKWKVVKWSLESGTERPVQNVNLNFHGFTYHANYGEKTEYGAFNIKNDTLTTIPEGQPAFSIRIVALTPDSMVLERNAGGSHDFMTLKRP